MQWLCRLEWQCPVCISHLWWWSGHLHKQLWCVLKPLQQNKGWSAWLIAPWIYPQMTMIPPWGSLDSVRPWSICRNPHPTAQHLMSWWLLRAFMTSAHCDSELDYYALFEKDYRCHSSVQVPFSQLCWRQHLASLSTELCAAFPLDEASLSSDSLMSDPNTRVCCTLWVAHPTSGSVYSAESGSVTSDGLSHVL